MDTGWKERTTGVACEEITVEMDLSAFVPLLPLWFQGNEGYPIDCKLAAPAHAFKQREQLPLYLEYFMRAAGMEWHFHNLIHALNEEAQATLAKYHPAMLDQMHHRSLWFRMMIEACWYNW